MRLFRLMRYLPFRGEFTIISGFQRPVAQARDQHPQAEGRGGEVDQEGVDGLAAAAGLEGVLGRVAQREIDGLDGAAGQEGGWRKLVRDQHQEARDERQDADGQVSQVLMRSSAAWVRNRGPATASSRKWFIRQARQHDAGEDVALTARAIHS